MSEHQAPRPLSEYSESEKFEMWRKGLLTDIAIGIGGRDTRATADSWAKVSTEDREHYQRLAMGALDSLTAHGVLKSAVSLAHGRKFFDIEQRQYRIFDVDKELALWCVSAVLGTIFYPEAK